jgi:hypothetical protein
LKKNRYSAAQALGYRSGLEVTTAAQLSKAGIPYEYEPCFFRYTKPAAPSRYTPDFVLPNGIVIETKGRFVPADRKKHLLLQAQHPALDIRFVFSQSSEKFSKASKTSYADWCEKNGFFYADKTIPQEWLKEAPEAGRIAAVTLATKK